MGGGTSVEEDPDHHLHEADAEEAGSTASTADDAKVELIEPTVVALQQSDEPRVCTGTMCMMGVVVLICPRCRRVFHFSFIISLYYVTRVAHRTCRGCVPPTKQMAFG
jgi:hypothetical protein